MNHRQHQLTKQDVIDGTYADLILFDLEVWAYRQPWNAAEQWLGQQQTIADPIAIRP